MQALAQHEKKPDGGRRRWPWILAAVLVALAAGGGGYAVAASRNNGHGSGSASAGASGGASSSGGAATASDDALSVVRTSPAKSATNVASNTTVTVAFSQSIAGDKLMPTITPPVGGSWRRVGASTLVFSPTAPFVPYTKYTVTVPGGVTGVASASGRHLDGTFTTTFTVASGSVQRLQQLLAVLGYLPVAYAEPSGVAPQDMAEPQAGTFAWRFPSLPATLQAAWIAGQTSEVTKAAVMQFETQNGLTVDGVAGPEVWSKLLDAAAYGKVDSAPYTYVLVTKNLPEHLTAWVNGNLQFANILVNTGVPGATTTDGTFAVFEHVRASTMKGTNVTGSTYDDPTVPWASYFNGGDALHGFTRASYGFPQSNGCVEMDPTTAGNLWPYTPVGTLVTVQGPPAT